MAGSTTTITPTTRRQRHPQQQSRRIRRLPEAEMHPHTTLPLEGEGNVGLRSLAVRPFRFGVVAALARSGEEWAEKARRIESMGYATLLMPDGLRYTLAPLPALTAAAMVTRTLRGGAYVIANDSRNPVLLAKEAASVDVLSGGRFELGIGVGRPAHAR